MNFHSMTTSCLFKRGTTFETRGSNVGSLYLGYCEGVVKLSVTRDYCQDR